MEVEVHCIQSEAIDAAIKPKANGLQQCGLNFFVVEVQIRLAGEEIVHVELFARAIPFPSWTAENRQPVVRRSAIGVRVCPNEPVGFGIVAANTAFLEPIVLIGAMRKHLVDHDFQAKAVGFGQHFVEIGQRTKHRVNVTIIGNIIAHVIHRGCEERGEPDRVNAKAGNIG